jgi:hypothetical protein
MCSLVKLSVLYILYYWYFLILNFLVTINLAKKEN